MLEVQKSLFESPDTIIVPVSTSLIQYSAVSSGLALTLHVRTTFVSPSRTAGVSHCTTGESESNSVSRTVR